ncbi:UNVERIFIED_CONTAM: hypothetical protein Sradi_6604100 [Sesamum radiatum]|uniref:Aminotransferase-like plant mobile domain-containing protein n=1 Tax=Sesamum radiatum TaxID=300843 RepID=A0AAW2JZD6_SESRA
MVYFKDKSSPSGENHLIILGNQNQPLEKGTMLAVYAPLIGGRNVSPWPRLTNSSPLSEWCQETSLSKNVKAWILRANHHEPPRHQPSDDFAHLCTLGRSIIEGDAKWDGDLRFTGEFRYTKGYWEWTEDVLSRCGDRLRHLKIYDAVYASLFTYDQIPISSKRFVKHVVPSALELTGVDEKRERFIPVPFWSKKTKYHSPPPRKEKKTVRPKSTHNPLGDIATHERWSTAEDALFAKLCIERSLKEEVYLAAYLACWLCLFVLPGNDVNSIRPSTFKMASLMANGRRVNLAIPVLASIYEGLNTIATSPKPAGTSHSFPIHFVYAWLACYFKTHYSVWQELRGPKMTRFSGEGGAKYYEPREARKRIHKAEFVSWACNMLVKAEPFKFVDDGRAEELDHSYFVAIRSSYLTLRRAADSSLSHIVLIDLGVNLGTIKMYQELSAYKAWWAKIHGTFFDDNIACLIRPKSIKITLKRKKDEGKQVDGGENDPPHALIPPIVIECDSQAAVVEASKGKCFSHNVADSDSSNKDRHWKRQRKEATPLKAAETNASRSSLANFVAELEDEVQSIDGEESETSHSSTMTPPLGMGLKRKQSSLPAAVSVLKGESFLFNYQKEFLQRLWSGLIVKISNTPIDFLSSIEDDVHLILESMKSFQKFDVSKVEDSLNMFFAKVRAYDEARSLSSEKLSQSLHEQQLKEVKARLQDVQAKASEEASEIQSVMDELEHVEEDIAVLKGQRTNLRATLKEKKQLNHDTQAKVHEVEKDLAALESTGPLDDAIVQNLESSRANLGIFTEDLKSLNPFA